MSRLLPLLSNLASRLLAAGTSILPELQYYYIDDAESDMYYVDDALSQALVSGDS